MIFLQLHVCNMYQYGAFPVITSLLVDQYTKLAKIAEITEVNVNVEINKLKSRSCGNYVNITPQRLFVNCSFSLYTIVWLLISCLCFHNSWTVKPFLNSWLVHSIACQNKDCDLKNINLPETLLWPFHDLFLFSEIFLWLLLDLCLMAINR